MLISSFLGIFIGYFIWDYRYTKDETSCNNDIIDIYYSDSTKISKLNLQFLKCPFTLNNCSDCQKTGVFDRNGNRINPVTILPCKNNSCKTYYLSRKNYKDVKSWFNSHQYYFNFPPFSTNQIYYNEKF
jgi:hypothetical protein